MSPTMRVQFSFGRKLSTCMRCGWASKEAFGPSCYICGADFDSVQVIFEDGTVLRITEEKGPGKEPRTRTILSFFLD